MKPKKLLALALSVVMAVTAIPFALLPLTASADAGADAVAFTAEASEDAPETDISLYGEHSAVKQVAATDVVGLQVNLTADVLTLTTNVPSYSNNTGSLTMALFAFDTDYDTTLLEAPLAEYTFVDFPDGGHLSFHFPENNPLPAGEYLVLFYDMHDDTPTADGGALPGIGLWQKKAFEGQRTYINGAYVGDATFPLDVKYATTPDILYALPTKPAVSENIDYAPHMTAVLDFRKEETMAYLGGANQINASFEEDHVSFKAAAGANDPYIFINLPDTLIKCSEYKVALLKLRRPEGSGRDAQLFFTTDETGLSEGASLRPSYADTTDWQYVVVNLGACGPYTGQLESLRFDIYQSCADRTEITPLDVAYIALFKSVDAAEAFHDNFEDFDSGDTGGVTAADPLQNPDYSTYISADTPDEAEAGKLTANGQLGYLYKEYPFAMDFSKSPEDHAAEGGFQFSAMDNAIVKDGRLQCKAFSTFSFYTKQFLGDDYALRGGALSMDLTLEDGSVTFVLRQIFPNEELTKSGLALTLTPDGAVTVIDRDGFADSTATGIDMTSEHRVAICDEGDTIRLEIDGETVYTLLYDAYTSTVKNADPDVEAHTSIHLPAAGYASVRVERLRGYMDNISYTYTHIVPKTVTGEHPVDYSTWVAVDDLGRVTPTSATVGDAQEKYVGLFYFMIHSDDMSSRYVNDVTRFYLEGGADLVSSKLSAFAGRNGAYWAEPYFGYYSSHDEWVYRKHAYMLDAAGVDFIFLDVSNNKFYVEQCKILFDTWKSIRNEGGHTPQICFMYGDMPFTLLNGLYTLLEPFYNNLDYEELLFCWEGKPLLLGNDDTPDGSSWTVSGTTPQTKAEYRQRVESDPDLKAFYENEYRTLLAERFTVRKCWAWQANTHKGYWDWLQESPQAMGTNPQGRREQMSVSMGVHAHTSRGRSYLNGDNTYNPAGEFGFTLDTSGDGLFFEEQFGQVMKYEEYVKVMMITGWNEWYAGVQSTSNQAQTSGQTATPGYYMVDQMSPEYSRDGEPMKVRDGIGFGDNYYYQMVTYIRQFKGMDQAPDMINGGSLNIADTTEWSAVSPAFTDTVGDTDLRNAKSFCAEFLYVNGTARNDLDMAKVSQDVEYLYFHITTATPLITVDDELWMNLYVNADNNAATGWEGFDFILNRSRTDDTVSVERFVDGKWVFEAVGEADYTLDVSSMTIKVSKTALGLTAGEAVSLTFKWADNADVRGDIMRFMELGDTAPNDRFAFAYTASTTEDERDGEAESPAETTPDTEPGETLSHPAVTDASADETETETDGDKGCASMAGGFTAVLAVAAGACAGMKKKEE